MPSALLSFNQHTNSSQKPLVRPRLPRRAPTALLAPLRIPCDPLATQRPSDIIGGSSEQARLTTKSGRPKTRSCRQDITPATTSTYKTVRSSALPTSVGPNFRALLQPSVRTLFPVFSRHQGRCSPDLPLSEVFPQTPAGLRPALVSFFPVASRLSLRIHRSVPFRASIRRCLEETA
jgi:hypothetical protein